MLSVSSPSALSITSGEATSPAMQLNRDSRAGGNAMSSSVISAFGSLAFSAAASREPMKPPPPVMRIFMSLPRFVS